MGEELRAWLLPILVALFLAALVFGATVGLDAMSQPHPCTMTNGEPGTCTEHWVPWR
jgi:hypothetical protein